MLKGKEVTDIFKDYYIEEDWIYANDEQFIVYRWATARWGGGTQKRYLKLGYREEKIGTSFNVDILHLTNGSEVRILKRCPICQEEDNAPWYSLTKTGTTMCRACALKYRRLSKKEVGERLQMYEDQRLTPIKKSPNRSNGKTAWLCECVCGEYVEVLTSAILSGHARSCGCLQRDMASRTGEDNPNWTGGEICYYGESWSKQRKKSILRDDNTCQRCGMGKEENGRNMDVHHIQKFKYFDYIQGENRNDIEANRVDNLVSLCMSCHKIVENNPEAINDFRNEKKEK